jgi:alkylhydroperoxidase family enzyme
MREGLLILGDHLPNPHTAAKATSAERHRQIVETAVRAEALGFDSVWLYRSPKRKLSPQLRELGQLRAGYARGSRFVFSQHCKAARSVGLSEDKVRAIKAWSVATCFSPVERAVLAYTDCLVLEGGRVPDGVFDALRAELDETEILELTYVTCTYDLHAVMCRALRLEYDDVDDPVTEVPAPASASADVMAVVDRVAE